MTREEYLERTIDFDDAIIRIVRLEKENKELKKKNLNAQDAVTMQMYTNIANKEIADKQLTKAKEIMKQSISRLDRSNYRESVVIEKLEQFLSEVGE